MNNRQEEAYKYKLVGWIQYGLRHDTIPNGLPDVMQIETTSYCNLRCVFCPYDELSRSKGHMNIDLFNEIISQMDHVATVGLHHFGEPLLNLEIDKFISHAESRGIQTTISTNITNLKGEMSQKILKSGLSRLIVSLDGSTPETYENLRRGAKYNEIIINIANFLHEKVKSGSAKPYVQMQLILTPETKIEQQEFLDKWSGHPGVDQVLFKDERTHAGSRIRHDKYVSREDNTRHPCRYLWESIVILDDGRVVPCCKDYDGKYILGNLSKGDTLQSIWNNDRMTQLRRAHLDGNWDSIELCKNCTEWPGHAAMSIEKTKEALSKFISYKNNSKKEAIHKKNYE